MVQKIKGQRVYKSMQGKVIDMDMLRKRNELTPAVGNAKINARGDELGPGGQIVRKREDILKDYYDNAQAIPDENPVRKSQTEQFTPPATAQTKSKAVKEVKTFVEEEDDEWVENDNGDFVKKDK